MTPSGLSGRPSKPRNSPSKQTKVIVDPKVELNGWEQRRRGRILAEQRNYSFGQGKQMNTPPKLPIKNIKLVKLLNIKKELMKRQSFLQEEGMIVNNRGQGIGVKKKESFGEGSKNIQSMAPSCVQIPKRPMTYSSTKTPDNYLPHTTQPDKDRIFTEPDDSHSKPNNHSYLYNQRQFGHLFHNYKNLVPKVRYPYDANQMHKYSGRGLSTVYQAKQGVKMRLVNNQLLETQNASKEEIPLSNSLVETSPYNSLIKPIPEYKRDKDLSTPFQYSLNALLSESTPNMQDQKTMDFFTTYSITSHSNQKSKYKQNPDMSSLK